MCNIHCAIYNVQDAVYRVLDAVHSVLCAVRNAGLAPTGHPPASLLLTIKMLEITK